MAKLFRRLRYLLPFLLLLAALYFYLQENHTIPMETGHVQLSDGDSFTLNGVRTRLYGIDAPELHQSCRDVTGQNYPCGKRAYQALQEMVINQPVQCTIIDKDRYGRHISVCRAGTTELNAEMVRQGWAVAYTQFALDYVPQESEARAQRRGLWSGTFTPPDLYRKEHPRN